MSKRISYARFLLHFLKAEDHDFNRWLCFRKMRKYYHDVFSTHQQFASLQIVCGSRSDAHHLIIMEEKIFNFSSSNYEAYAPTRTGHNEQDSMQLNAFNCRQSFHRYLFRILFDYFSTLYATKWSIRNIKQDNAYLIFCDWSRDLKAVALFYTLSTVSAHVKGFIINISRVNHLSRQLDIWRPCRPQI